MTTRTSKTAKSKSSEKLFKLFLDHLSTEHDWTDSKIQQLLKAEVVPKKPLLIPTSIFYARELSALELIVKFLHETKLLGFSDIAKNTNRDPRTIWHVYAAAHTKHPKPLSLKPTEYTFPLDILAERKLSVLESIVHHLRESYGLPYAQIAKLLNRDPRTVHTVKNRIDKKIKNE